MDSKWQEAKWRKSNTSDSGGCVEVARVGSTIGVRDTKAKGHGPMLEFDETEWCAFLAGVSRGEFTFEALAK
jgi:hypothetical protein